MSDSEETQVRQQFLEELLAPDEDGLEGPQLIGPVEVTLSTMVHSARTPAEAVEFVILNLARNGLQDRFYRVTEVEPPSEGEEPGQWLVRDGHTLTEDEVRLLYAATKESDLPSPLTVACQECGAGVDEACKPRGDEPKGLIGYHDARYLDAGWPTEDEGDDDEPAASD